jgi:hypothetical protein
LCFTLCAAAKEIIATESLSSDLPSSLETMGNDVAVQAIKYMKMAQKKLMKDFNYTKMETRKMK